jgi:hypothetical protein
MPEACHRRTRRTSGKARIRYGGRVRLRGRRKWTSVPSVEPCLENGQRSLYSRGELLIFVGKKYDYHISFEQSQRIHIP